MVEAASAELDSVTLSVLPALALGEVVSLAGPPVPVALPVAVVSVALGVPEGEAVDGPVTPEGLAEVSVAVVSVAVSLVAVALPGPTEYEGMASVLDGFSDDAVAVNLLKLDSISEETLA